MLETQNGALAASRGAQTFSDQLAASGGRPTGFDYLRILLACSVVVLHAPGICYGADLSNRLDSFPGFHAASEIVLPMFFALSGFLVAGSLERSRTIVGFLGLRAIRIYPALVVEVCLSAFLLGAFFTTLPLHSYFGNSLFLRYLVNVTGHISFYLPGVFASNPLTMANYQLWTVPFELYCYIALAVMMVLGATKRPTLFVALAAGVIIALLGHHLWAHRATPFQEAYAGHIEGNQLVCSFLCGVGFYLFKGMTPWRRSWTIASAILGILLLSVPLGSFLAAPSVAYLTIALGLGNPRKFPVLQGADYSYGVYLYGWPIQQALITAFPQTRIWWLNAVLALTLCGVFAALSWHTVEKPALRARQPLRRLEDRWIRAKGGLDALTKPRHSALP